MSRCGPSSLAEWDAFPNELRYSSLRFTVTRLRDFFLQANGWDGPRNNKDFREFFERVAPSPARKIRAAWKPLLMAMATGYDYRKYQKIKASEWLNPNPTSRSLRFL